MSAHTSTRNCISIANKYDRVILLVDMDCFYCQVEEKLNPSLKGKPLAVVQYNAWRGGGIIAVNYPARAKGVTRHMRGDEAKKQCPDIELVKVPSVREKADLTKYREAGKEVANVLQRFTPLLERASVDEAYLDITDAVNKRVQLMNKGSFELQPKQLFNTYAVGYSGIGEFLTTITTMYQTPSPSSTACAPIYQSNLRLLAGASIATEIRASVKADTGYECSAGIAHNKILAKLACGINKPNKQTILTLDQIPTLFATLPLNKIKGLGGKFGEDIANLLNVHYVGDLLNFTEQDLQSKFDEKNGTWLYNICRGIDLEAVTPRFYSKSIGCCKKFPGRNNITGIKSLQHWLNELANEINERLEKDLMENNRRAKQMVVSFVQEFNGEETSSSRSAPLNTYEPETLAKNALDLIKNNTKQFLRAGSDGILNNPIKFLGISVGKFETVSAAKTTLQEMFANQATAAAAALSNKENENLQNAENVKENETCSTASSEAPVKSSKDMKSFLLPRIEKKDVKKPDEFLVTNKRDEKPMNRTESYFISMLQKPDEKNPESTKSPERNKNELNPLMDNRQSPSEACGNDNTFNNPADTTSTTNIIQSTAIQENSDYRVHYAEYATPTFQEDLLNFITCPECNKKVPNDAKALQMHQDHHYAHQLSQQQRLEYREEIKAKSLNTTKFPQSNTSTAGLKRKAKKSPPTNVTKVKNPLLGDIKKFLKPETTLINIEIAATSDNSIKCDKCKEMIEKKDMQEHQDYHMAKELQKEINQHPIQKLNVKETAPSKTTRLQPLTSVLSSSKPKVISKPITQFFAQL